MPSTAALLIPPKQAEIAQTTQYTSPAGGKGALLDKFTATNTSGVAVTLSVNLISTGGAADGNLVAKARSIAAGATETFPDLVGHFLPPGALISTAASAATSITIRASGRELT